MAIETERVETVLLARGLAAPVVVTHPTFNGRMQEWRVEIDEIERRTTTRLSDGSVIEVVSFRGVASTADGWTGRKAFFAPKCVRILDLATGEIVEGDVAGWLEKRAAARTGR
jgi:hypothetical protein